MKLNNVLGLFSAELQFPLDCRIYVIFCLFEIGLPYEAHSCLEFVYGTGWS